VASNKYDQSNIETMEMLYGTGYLSMGGDDEVANIVAAVVVEGKDVLDLGCGLGGALIALARNHRAGYVHGLDIDAGVLQRAASLVEQAGLKDRVKLSQFEPGPLPLDDNSIDLAFVTAVSCHIEDLVPFFSEIHRVIRPGGYLVGGEWFKNIDNEAYREWDDLLRERGLNFYFVTGQSFTLALQQSGFTGVSIINRNTEMTAMAEQYLERSEGELKDSLLDIMEEEGYASLMRWTRTRARGLASGGSGYGHFVASK
jgi:SAM-dependent methyltransferase